MNLRRQASLSWSKSFFVFAFLFVSAVSYETENVSAVENDADPMIRQVVGGDHRLGAEHHFSLFKRKFGKSYGSKEEYDYRFNIFKANLRRARRHQNLNPTALHGVTQFSDLTPSEFRKVLGLKGLGLPADANKAPTLPTDDLPSDFDWRDHFSATGALEGAHFLSTGELVSLSEHQLVDCDHEDIKPQLNWSKTRCWGSRL